MLWRVAASSRASPLRIPSHKKRPSSLTQSDAPQPPTTNQPRPTPTKQRKEREFRARLDGVARLYGVAAAMRLKTEKEVLSAQAARLPGLPSSRVGLETVLGTDETIEFEDVLNGACVHGRRVWGGGG